MLEVKGRVAVIGLGDSPSEDFWEATSLAKDSQLKYYRYDELRERGLSFIFLFCHSPIPLYLFHLSDMKMASTAPTFQSTMI